MDKIHICLFHVIKQHEEGVEHGRVSIGVAGSGEDRSHVAKQMKLDYIRNFSVLSVLTDVIPL